MSKRQDTGVRIQEKPPNPLPLPPREGEGVQRLICAMFFNKKHPPMPAPLYVNKEARNLSILMSLAPRPLLWGEEGVS